MTAKHGQLTFYILYEHNSTLTCTQEQSQRLSVEEQTLRCRKAQVEERERVLEEQQEKVYEMERLACEAHNALAQCIEKEVARRLQEYKQVEPLPSSSIRLRVLAKKGLTSWLPW